MTLGKQNERLQELLLRKEKINVSIPKDKNKQEEEELYNDKKRNEASKNTMHKVSIFTIWVLWVIVVFLFIVRAIHYVTPDCWGWLSEPRLQSLDKFLFSGAIGAILGKFGDRILYK